VGLETGAGAELVSGIPEPFLQRGIVRVLFRWGYPNHVSGCFSCPSFSSRWFERLWTFWPKLANSILTLLCLHPDDFDTRPPSILERFESMGELRAKAGCPARAGFEVPFQCLITTNCSQTRKQGQSNLVKAKNFPPLPISTTLIRYASPVHNSTIQRFNPFTLHASRRPPSTTRRLFPRFVPDFSIFPIRICFGFRISDFPPHVSRFTPPPIPI